MLILRNDLPKKLLFVKNVNITYFTKWYFIVHGINYIQKYKCMERYGASVHRSYSLYCG